MQRGVPHLSMHRPSECMWSGAPWQELLSCLPLRAPPTGSSSAPPSRSRRRWRRPQREPQRESSCRRTRSSPCLLGWVGGRSGGGRGGWGERINAQQGLQSQVMVVLEQLCSSRSPIPGLTAPVLQTAAHHALGIPRHSVPLLPTVLTRDGQQGVRHAWPHVSGGVGSNACGAAQPQDAHKHKEADEEA